MCAIKGYNMEKNKVLILSVAGSVTAMLIGCATPMKGGNEAATVTYENTIRALVKEQCSECHGSDSPTMEEFDKDKEGFKKKKLGPRFDTYEYLIEVVSGGDAGALMRRLDDGTNTKDGKPGNMYKNLGSDDREKADKLALFKRWVGHWSLKRAKELSDDERKLITAPR